MGVHADTWMGVYYPEETIENRRSRAILCLLFDKVMCHVPIAGTECGGGAGMSDSLFQNDVLAKAGVLEPREEELLSEHEVDFTPGRPGGTEEEEFNRYVRLQITAMAMQACKAHEAVPVTDDPNWPIPASLLSHLDVLRFAKLQATALAIESLKISLPSIAPLRDDEILEARDRLHEELVRFRIAMLALSPALRSGLESEASMPEIMREAKYIAETQIRPALVDIQRRLDTEKGRFWRRLVLKGAGILPQFIVNWVSKGALSAAMTAFEKANEAVATYFDHLSLVECLKAQGGLGFLLAVGDIQSGNRKS